MRIVPPGEEAAFLADLPIDDLPVSTEMRRRLRLLGLRRLGDLARLPAGAVAAEFGAEGARAWDLAHGVDRSPLAPYRLPRSLTERLAFPTAIEASDGLITAVRKLLERALRRPMMRGRAARVLLLRLYLENGQVWEREVTFREPVGSADRMLLVLRTKIESAIASGSLAACSEVELTLQEVCGESVSQEHLFPTRQQAGLATMRGNAIGLPLLAAGPARALNEERVAEAARQLKARYGRPMLARVMEVEPWSRIPERRFALIDYDP